MTGLEGSVCLCGCAWVYSKCVQIICSQVCVCAGYLGGMEEIGDGWRAAAFLIQFNSIRQDILTCAEDHLLAYAKHTARGLRLTATPKRSPPLRSAYCERVDVIFLSSPVVLYGVSTLGIHRFIESSLEQTHIVVLP